MNISSTSSSSSSSTDYGRLTGLASGLDTDGLVKQGLAGDQTKIDQVKQDTQYLEWQQDAYVGFINDLKTFNNYFDVLNSDNLMLSKSYNGTVATSTLATSGVSGDQYLTATTYPGAAQGNYEVQINNLATTSKKQVTLTGATNTTKLVDLGINNGSFTIQAGSNTFTINITDNNETVGDFVNSLKGAMDGAVPITQYLNIGFSELTQKLTIETKATGQGQQFTIGADTNGGNIVSKFNMAGLVNNGLDASLSIKAPGETVATPVTKSSNTFTIDNVTYNLLGKPGDTINLNIKADASDAVDKFKKFIDKYNALIDKINTKLNEKKSYDYKPLTDAQKAAMKDSEITAWESKAKEGILRRDNYLTDIVSKMRQAIYDKVNGAGLSITEVGISTTDSYLEGGKLVYDETKMKAAFEQKGDLVKNLFTQSSSSYDNQGIFQRFKTIINDAVGSDGTLIKKAGYTNTRWVASNDLSKRIAEKNTKLKQLQSMMADKKQRLYSMYATLEKNLNSLNSQSSWLASSLGTQ